MSPPPCHFRAFQPGTLNLFLHRLAPEEHFSSPVLSQVFPPWVHLFNQRNLLFSAPAFQLLLSALCHVHVVVLFVVNKTIAVVFPGEAIDLTRFVLKNTRVNETRHTNVERACAAGHNVDPEYVKAPFAHAENSSTLFLLKLPASAWSEDTSSGSFDSPLLLPSRVLAQDWAGLEWLRSYNPGVDVWVALVKGRPFDGRVVPRASLQVKVTAEDNLP